MAHVFLLTAARWTVWNQSDGQLKFSLKRVSHIRHNTSTGDVRIGLHLLGSMTSKEERRRDDTFFIGYFYVF